MIEIKECPRCEAELTITITYRDGRRVYHICCNSCNYEDYTTED